MPESTLPDDNAPETALRVDPRFTEPQKRALLAVYPAISDRTVLGPRTMRRMSYFVKWAMKRRPSSVVAAVR